MRILILNWRDIKHPWKGGSEVNIHNISKELVNKGYQITMLTAGWRGNKKREETVDGVNLIRVGGRYSIYFLLPVYFIKNCFWKKFDLILDLENGIPFFTPLFTRKKSICFIHHIHKDVFFKELPYIPALIGATLETKFMPLIYRKNNFICISPSTREDLIKLGVEEERINIIYPGVDTYPVETVNQCNKPIITYVGRLQKYKRPDILIDLYKDLSKEIDHLKLTIAGYGEEYDDLKERIQAEGLSNGIELLGYVSEKRKLHLLQNTRVFVNPSSMEGWGISVIEANANGAPAVAFNVPGLRDSIIHGETGLLANDYQQFKAYTKNILTNDEIYKHLQLNAVKHAKKFSWASAAKELLKLIDKV